LDSDWTPGKAFTYLYEDVNQGFDQL